jgi:acetoin utilization protein AcuC
MSAPVPVAVVVGEAIARYGFGNGHPFGQDRHEHFVRELAAQGLDERVVRLAPRMATIAELASFHSSDYIEFVQPKIRERRGFLDGGDTPAFRGVFEAAGSVVGATLVALDSLMSGASRAPSCPSPACITRHGPTPPDSACSATAAWRSNACVRTMACKRIAYVDIDAHHGDGVFYAFEDDPDLGFADIHEDGRDLYPGTGAREETGRGAAAGTKLNLPLAPGAGDAEFMRAWEEVEAYLERFPERLHPVSNAVPTASPATRSRTCVSARRRMPMPRGVCARSPTGRDTAGCSAWAAAATTGAISHGPGPPWCSHSWSRVGTQTGS